MHDVTELLTTEEAAKYLRVTSRSLIRWRINRLGPPCIRMPRHVRYRRADLDAWLEAHTQRMVCDVVA